MTMTRWPITFPKALMEDYALEVKASLIRTEFDSGVTRQRRKNRTMPTLFNIGLVVKIGELGMVQNFINSFCYDWFEMPLTSYLTPLSNTSQNCSPHIVRFIADLVITPFTDEYVKITVQAEQAPPSLYGLPSILTNDWVVAKTPDAPAVEWVIAGTPDNPSIKYVLSGSPSFPAAII